MSLVGIPGFNRAEAGYLALRAHPIYAVAVAATAAVWASGFGAYCRTVLGHAGYAAGAAGWKSIQKDVWGIESAPKTDATLEQLIQIFPKQFPKNINRTDQEGIRTNVQELADTLTKAKQQVSSCEDILGIMNRGTTQLLMDASDGVKQSMREGGLSAPLSLSLEHSAQGVKEATLLLNGLKDCHEKKIARESQLIDGMQPQEKVDLLMRWINATLQHKDQELVSQKALLQESQQALAGCQQMKEKTQKAETAEQKALTCAADLKACLAGKGTVEGEKSQVQQMLDSVKGNLDNCVSQKSNLEKAIPSYQNMTQAAEADLADCLASLETCANGGEVV